MTRSQLIAICEELGEAATDRQIDSLQRYVELLQRWNAVYNLTAVRETEQVLTHHVADCLAAVARLPGESLRLLDVGSGGGLPGVVIAIMRPLIDVTCVDSVGKKMAFVRQAVGALDLTNARALHVRVEELGGPGYEIVTSRAFASLSDFVAKSEHLLEHGGRWMAMKGRISNDELLALPFGVEVFHVEHLKVPQLDAARCLVWMRQATQAVEAA